VAIVVGCVEHDEATCVRSRRELLVRLVVPVEDDRVAANAGTPRVRQLAERRSLGAQPFLGEDRQHGDVGERLHAVQHVGVWRRLAVGASPRPQRLLAVDDERRPVRAGELGARNAAEGELSAIDRGALWEEIEHGARR
jgi:hypothetical protein